MEVIVRAESDAAGFLVLSDNYYSGWKASIDGRETKIYRANYTFRAVWVSKGDHTVRFFYEPASFRWGKRITTAAIIVTGVLFAIFLFKKHAII